LQLQIKFKINKEDGNKDRFPTSRLPTPTTAVEELSQRPKQKKRTLGQQRAPKNQA
jgi:hypothetical protein